MGNNHHHSSANINQKAQKFYTDLSRVNTVTVNNPDDLSEKIQLRASINQIKKGCVSLLYAYYISFLKHIILFFSLNPTFK